VFKDYPKAGQDTVISHFIAHSAITV